jgi:hypothetical protein
MVLLRIVADGGEWRKLVACALHHQLGHGRVCKVLPVVTAAQRQAADMEKAAVPEVTPVCSFAQGESGQW